MFNRDVFYRQLDDVYERRDIDAIEKFLLDTLRAQGDTQRPLFYLTISGILNVLLNLFFVIVLKMNVAGVALATISSQAVRTVPGSPVHCPLAKRDSRNCPDVPVQAYSQNGAVRTVPSVPL